MAIRKFLLCTAFLACNPSTNTGGGGGGSGTVGPSGGTVGMGDGVTIEIPPGALTEDVPIRISKATVKRDGMLSINSYQFEPEGLTFQKPVKVTLPYLRTPGLPADVDEPVQVYRAPKGSEEFQDLGGTVLENGLVQAETPGFSVFLAGIATSTLIAGGQKYPQGLAVNGTHVYFSSFGTVSMPLSGNNGRVMRVEIGNPLSTSVGAQQVFANSQVDPKRLALNATYLYWTNGGSGPMANDAGIMRAPLAGGAATRLITSTFPVGIAIDATYVYWIDADDQKIYRALLDGTGKVTMATTGPRPSNLAVNGSYLYWINRGSSGVTDGKVQYAAINTPGTATVIASTQAEPMDIAVDSSGVYWVNGANGKVQKTGLTGGTVTTLRTLTRPTAVALDSTKYYVTDMALGRVIAYPKAGGNGVVKATSSGNPTEMAQDASNLYWINEGLTEYLGEVRAIRK